MDIERREYSADRMLGEESKDKRGDVKKCGVRMRPGIISLQNACVLSWRLQDRSMGLESKPTFLFL